MPSNSMYACLTCRVGGKNPYPACVANGHDVKCFGRRITIPKKNNNRAWKRIANDDYLWDKRKVRRGGKHFFQPDTVHKYDMEFVNVEVAPNRTVRQYLKVEGSEREVTNFDKRPEVDLGG